MPTDIITLNHGSGGRSSNQLIEAVFYEAFDNDLLRQGNDSVCLPMDFDGQLAFTTDSYVVSPLFFPGGDIGHLAVNGTVNDLAMAGATPKYLSVAFILEEGFAIADLKRICQSMASAAKEAEVRIVTGDTKVVERGKCDGVFINTSGIGVKPAAFSAAGDQAQPGDSVIVSGNVGDHGLTILTQRENLEFGSGLESDTAPLNHLVRTLVNRFPNAIHSLRDATRGGLAAVVNELASQSKVSIHLHEKNIPVNAEVTAACEFLGLDPLTVANEGKLVCICKQEHAEEILTCMREMQVARDAAIIGSVGSDRAGLVSIQSAFGGVRALAWPSGELLPRIC